MKTGIKLPTTIDEYIATCSPEVQPILERIRALVKKAAPDATEKISYRIPTFTTKEGILVHFAAFKSHIGFYPPVRGDAALMKDLARYAGPQGNLRFPLAERIPYGLITRIVKARLRENRQRAEERRAKAKRRQ
ncbi:MAG: DUF1801 domain-containing protein [Blastocatellia bacterium]|nr:DUF1801 domain-containing protein [Blastocatellia bacterium]